MSVVRRTATAVVAVGVVAAGAAATVSWLGTGDDHGPRHVVPGGDAERGRELLVTYGCTSCHAVPGVPSVERGVGPDLAGMDERLAIAGHLPNRPEELIRWIRDPQEIAPGTLMPDMGVDAQDARDMAAYLYGP
ncbi:c-type cytochrome [Cellulosimicrobium sp. NPDC057127]|uniref:c-type cytochrome n=1 Tax=Cellulosimicrobium sp. NPDC057127 TaxID=3346026 RepID=UPI00362C7F57